MLIIHIWSKQCIVNNLGLHSQETLKVVKPTEAESRKAVSRSCGDREVEGCCSMCTKLQYARWKSTKDLLYNSVCKGNNTVLCTWKNLRVYSSRCVCMFFLQLQKKLSFCLFVLFLLIMWLFGANVHHKSPKEKRIYPSW